MKSKNRIDQRDLLLASLASVREKLDKVKAGDSISEKEVVGKYRRIFNNNDDPNKSNPDYGNQQYIKRDIQTKYCGIDSLDKFLDSMGCCWLDFFGSDSFSDLKKKKQIFFATLCKHKTASKDRKTHVKKYQEFLNKDVPVDILIQVFFATKKELNGFTKLRKISKEGFAIKFQSGVKQKPDYKKEIEEVKDLYTNENPSIVQEKLFRSLENSLPDVITKEVGLICLDYENKFGPSTSTSLTHEERFLKGVCDINWSLHKEVEYVYFMPIPSPDGSDGLACFGTKKTEPLKVEERNQLNALSFEILYPFVSSYKTAWQRKEIQIESIKSAVAAIMSRNMSHNLGSHYLTNTKNYFGKRANLGLIKVKEGVKTKEEKEVLDEELKLLASDYRGNARLLQYIQERMDFIATIVSTDRYPLGPMNFKAEFFDVLTNDDCGERHGKPEKNFLLQYLLFSEKYTRFGHFGDIVDTQFDNVRLEVIYNNNSYTGQNAKFKEEQSLKMSLSKLRLAVPGGIMSRHALFTIIENILRNSAKHNKKRQGEELVLTIDIQESSGKCAISIYDNCQGNKDGKLLLDIVNRLKNVKIIDANKNNSIDKTNKGLKEVLICALWLQNKDIARTLMDIQENRDDALKYLPVSDRNGSLCYTITLDTFELIHNVENDLEKSGNSLFLPIEKMLQFHSDYVVAKKDYFVLTKYGGKKKDSVKKKLSELFPRFEQIVGIDHINEEEIKNIILNKKTNKGYRILVDYPSEPEENIPDGVLDFHRNDRVEVQPKDIVFLDHYLNGGLDEAKKKIDAVNQAFYVDTISGENFTSTIISPAFLNDPFAKLKVIDSARKKIVILDERIWADYRSRWVSNDIPETELMNAWGELSRVTPEQYDSCLEYYSTKVIKYVRSEIIKFNKLGRTYSSLNSNQKKNLVENLFMVYGKQRAISRCLLEKRNIYVCTMQNDDHEKHSFVDIEGNVLEKGYLKSHFLTVHLGLIEKYVENQRNSKPKDFIEKLKEVFRPDFICIHSGRGNFSPELEEGLRSYPFISLSALDAALENSKYLLSELLNNTNYYGKGNINHK